MQCHVMYVCVNIYIYIHIYIYMCILNALNGKHMLSNPDVRSEESGHVSGQQEAALQVVKTVQKMVERPVVQVGPPPKHSLGGILGK